MAKKLTNMEAIKKKLSDAFTGHLTVKTTYLSLFLPMANRNHLTLKVKYNNLNRGNHNSFSHSFFIKLGVKNKTFRREICCVGNPAEVWRLAVNISLK